MALDNEKEVVEIITKLYKAIDATYLDYLANSSYNYISQITDSYTINQLVANNLTEQELNVLVIALSDDEIEVNKLIIQHSNLEKFFKRVRDANTKPIVRGIMYAYMNIKETKRQTDALLKKQKEGRELYKAARLTPRQKQVLTTLGLPLSTYEKIS